MGTGPDLTGLPLPASPGLIHCTQSLPKLTPRTQHPPFFKASNGTPTRPVTKVKSLRLWPLPRIALQSRCSYLYVFSHLPSFFSFLFLEPRSLNNIQPWIPDPPSTCRHTCLLRCLPPCISRTCFLTFWQWDLPGHYLKLPQTHHPSSPLPPLWCSLQRP